MQQVYWFYCSGVALSAAATWACRGRSSKRTRVSTTACCIWRGWSSTRSLAICSGARCYGNGLRCYDGGNMLWVGRRIVSRTQLDLAAMARMTLESMLHEQWGPEGLYFQQWLRWVGGD